jgi:hypothetical protein
LTFSYSVSGTASPGPENPDFALTGFDPWMGQGSVTIWGGSSTAVLTLTPEVDSEVEGNETVIVTLVPGGGACGSGDYLVGTSSNATVTIEDGIPPGITVTPTSGLITDEAGGTATFTVVLDSEPTANVLIGVYPSDSTEGICSASGLLFTAANWSQPRTVTVTGVNDDVDDDDIVYTIVTAAASSTDPNYDQLNASDVSVTNTDNDTAGIAVSATPGLVTDETGGTATFTVVLESEPTADVTVTVQSDNTTEGTVSPTSLMFTAADWDQPQTVTVTGANDDLSDGDITYTIGTGAAVSADPNYSGIDPGRRDRDEPGR